MKKRKKLWAAAAVLGLLTALYCNHTIQRETWTVTSTRLPQAFDGLRITLLTDLHGAQLENLAEEVKRSEPDLIAICGDLADESTDCAALWPLLEQLCQVAPVYYVTGNHEWVREDTEQLLENIADCGVTVLRNSYVCLQRQGQTLVLAGAEDPNGYADQETPEAFLTRVRREVGGDPYVVLLYHRNDALEQWANLGADVVLSGHGHGGVIRLPVVGGVLGVDRSLFPDNCEGLLRQGRTTMAVSRGLGGLRLWNPPHLPTVVLQAEP